MVSEGEFVDGNRHLQVALARTRRISGCLYRLGVALFDLESPETLLLRVAMATGAIGQILGWLDRHGSA